MHFGVCSNYLARLNVGDKVQCFFRRYLLHLIVCHGDIVFQPTD